MDFTGKPLAERVRPQTLEDLIGQEHLVGKEGVLRRAINAGRIPSMILWGPPGVGKTTIANIIANSVKAPFFTLSAISSGVKEVREVIQRARFQSNTILFIDEIHRFNKSQQDALLGAVEKGDITLIGATTENPSFEVNSALLSRSQVYTLKSLTKEDLFRLIEQALAKDEILSKRQVELKETQALFNISGGDARKLLNLLDLVVQNIEGDPAVVTDELVKDIAQQRVATYDKTGDMHYDVISAFIKSIRGSDPNAAVYYLARMIEGGEDIKFIARRLVILASEDIGNANPTALVIATNAFQAVNLIGYPEGRIILSQAVTYLASSPKSNAAYMAIGRAQELVRKTGDLSIPMPIRNAPTKLMKEEGYGQGYKYSHDYPGNFVQQEFLPQEIKGTKLYDPKGNAREDEMRKRLKAMWKEKYGY
ncbi:MULTISPECIES: replication-associated recombination protein A [Roseivirga]|uniref:Replication-associated recombination protein A n=1 Tax=Roseivirga spongicola TaxID=333140 RepID=A0A150XI69_9BACT|nr:MULTISPECIES: replication-associated recombination protein A [Roseivirga]KYG78430.1 AAA family ATPase [Roseivirga spongicola]MBO6660746.1 replication-associated recombination protein A [Roseivirga sp.]MBO6762253.1 replication-associated recombination protein A [Roseivirga sp.]MBO6909270.1 replication-associated recombination protein A [Roseivirga sp.]WPZ12178.1 replication-associated recombination protein A [Roseivirga spongicola]